MKLRLTALLLALCLAGLPSCNQSPAPPQSDDPALILEEAVAGLEADTLTVWGYAMGGQADGSPNVTAEKLLPLLRSAMEHQTNEAQITYPGLWSLELSQGDPDTAATLLLSAGLTENLVELSLLGSEVSVYLDDAQLYQLIRTMCDDHTLSVMDEDAYARYRDVVDGEFDTYFANADASVRWELTGFSLCGANEALGAEVYCAKRAYSSDPPEDILLRLAGGDYVDSQLRLHPTRPEFLLVLDGQARGFFYTELTPSEIAGFLSQYTSSQALLAELHLN